MSIEGAGFDPAAFTPVLYTGTDVDDVAWAADDARALVSGTVDQAATVAESAARTPRRRAGGNPAALSSAAEEAAAVLRNGAGSGKPVAMAAADKVADMIKAANSACDATRPEGRGGIWGIAAAAAGIGLGAYLLFGRKDGGSDPKPPTDPGQGPGQTPTDPAAPKEPSDPAQDPGQIPYPGQPDDPTQGSTQPGLPPAGTDVVPDGDAGIPNSPTITVPGQPEPRVSLPRGWDRPMSPELEPLPDGISCPPREGGIDPDLNPGSGINVPDLEAVSGPENLGYLQDVLDRSSLSYPQREAILDTVTQYDLDTEANAYMIEWLEQTDLHANQKYEAWARTVEGARDPYAQVDMFWSLDKSTKLSTSQQMRVQDAVIASGIAEQTAIDFFADRRRWSTTDEYDVRDFENRMVGGAQPEVPESGYPMYPYDEGVQSSASSFVGGGPTTPAAASVTGTEDPVAASGGVIALPPGERLSGGE